MAWGRFRVDTESTGIVPRGFKNLTFYMLFVQLLVRKRVVFFSECWTITSVWLLHNRNVVTSAQSKFCEYATLVMLCLCNIMQAQCLWPHDHMIIWSCCHTIIWSYAHMATLSYDNMIIYHMIILSYDDMIIWSYCYSIIWSYDHMISNHFQMTTWRPRG